METFKLRNNLLKKANCISPGLTANAGGHHLSELHVEALGQTLQWLSHFFSKTGGQLSWGVIIVNQFFFYCVQLILDISFLSWEWGTVTRCSLSASLRSVTQCSLIVLPGVAILPAALLHCLCSRVFATWISHFFVLICSKHFHRRKVVCKLNDPQCCFGRRTPSSYLVNKEQSFCLQFSLSLAYKSERQWAFWWTCSLAFPQLSVNLVKTVCNPPKKPHSPLFPFKRERLH